MLDRLRFQEVEKAIFRTREEMKYSDRCLLKNEAFLIVDNATISHFNVSDRNRRNIGRSTEATTSTIRGVTLELTNGQIMLDLFNTIYGDIKNSQSTTFTINETVMLNDTDTIELPSKPASDVILYFTDEYGRLTRIANDQYSIEDNIVTFIKPITRLITYDYEEEATSKLSAGICQIGEDIIGTLEMQCIAMDIQTEETIRVLMKFDKVFVSTDLNIDFNNSSKASGSVIQVSVAPDDMQGKFNKQLFSIEVI